MKKILIVVLFLFGVSLYAQPTPLKDSAKSLEEAKITNIQIVKPSLPTTRTLIKDTLKYNASDFYLSFYNTLMALKNTETVLDTLEYQNPQFSIVISKEWLKEFYSLKVSDQVKKIKEVVDAKKLY